MKISDSTKQATNPIVCNDLVIVSETFCKSGSFFRVKTAFRKKIIENKTKNTIGNHRGVKITAITIPQPLESKI